MRRWLAAAALLAAASCGKKADPVPPLPKVPARTTDLAVEQQASQSVVSFTFPSLRADGEALRDLAEIDIYRMDNPSPSLAAAGVAPGAAPSAPGPAADRAPIAGERRRAAAARARESAFLETAKKIAAIKSGEFSEATRGSRLIWRDSLEAALSAQNPPKEIAYALVSVRATGDRSEISNIALLSPVIPPGRPENLFAWAEADRVCLVWSAPECDVAGKDVGELGYRVYRRRLEDEEFGAPLDSAPVEATDFTDTTAAYNNDYVYTVTASAREHPKSEGPPAIQFGIPYRDVYPPPPPERLDALPEESLVRLLWTPVHAADLAGYDLYRSEDGGEWKKLNGKPLGEAGFLDRGVAPGRSYRYRVLSVDQAGNASEPSPEAEARPYAEQP